MMDKKALKDAYTDWFVRMPGKIAFTGTFRQTLRSTVDAGARDFLTVEKARRNIEQFVERVSRPIFGRSAVRRGEKLFYAGSIEGDEGGPSGSQRRLHTHLAIGNVPAGFDLVRLDQILRDKWKQSRWGYEEVDVQQLENRDDLSRWISYGLKTFKLGNTERFISNYALN